MSANLRLTALAVALGAGVGEIVHRTGLPPWTPFALIPVFAPGFLWLARRWDP